MRRLIILKTAIFVGSLSFGHALLAEEAKKEKVDPLKEALASAYLTNSTLRAKLHGQYAIDESVNQAFSKFRPQVAASGSVGKNSSKSKVPGRLPSTSNLDPESLSVQVSQSLYHGGSDLAGLRAAEAAAKAGQYDLLNTEQDTLLRAVSAYLEVIFQKASVKSKESNVDYLTKQLKGIKAQVEVGEKTPTETAAAESALAQGMAELVKSQGDLQNARANYLNVIGKEPDLLEFPKPLMDLPASLDEVKQKSLKTNPAILNAEFVAKQAGIAIDAANGALLPSLDLTGTASRAFNQNVNKDISSQANATLKLSVPIYQSGAEYSKIREQTDKSVSASHQLDQARKTVVENATKAWEGLITSRQRITSFEKQVEAAKKARDGALLESDVGERSYTEVIQFQQKVLEADIALEDARRNEILAQYQLYAVEGRLTADYLALPVTLYDVQGHLDEVSYKMIGFGNSSQDTNGKNE
ncbi:MAG: TolC family outer membrane protein [Alphaproteobacteria bacterium]|nr:TolC family outer membrane protein [Alphaproteobacteria bacterium]